MAELVSFSLCWSMQLDAAKHWGSDSMQNGGDVCLRALMGAEPL